MKYNKLKDKLMTDSKVLSNDELNILIDGAVCKLQNFRRYNPVYWGGVASNLAHAKRYNRGLKYSKLKEWLRDID